MSTKVTITFDIEIDREIITPDISEALDNLAYAMEIQQEDGLTLLDEEGSPICPPVAYVSRIRHTINA